MRCPRFVKLNTQFNLRIRVNNIITSSIPITINKLSGSELLLTEINHNKIIYDRVIVIIVS